MTDAANAVSEAAVSVLVSHGLCSSMPDCANTRELLVSGVGRGVTSLDVFDIDNPALAFEVATTCGRLVGTSPQLRQIIVRIHRTAPRRPARGQGGGSRSGRGIPGWSFTFELI